MPTKIPLDSDHTPSSQLAKALKIRAAVSLVYPTGDIEFDHASVGIEKLCSDKIESRSGLELGHRFWVGVRRLDLA